MSPSEPGESCGDIPAFGFAATKHYSSFEVFDVMYTTGDLDLRVAKTMATIGKAESDRVR
jgi:hypothetical protein